MSDRVDAGGKSGRHRRGKPVAEVRANELDGERVVAVREDGVELRGGGVDLISDRVQQHVGREIRAEAGHLGLLEGLTMFCTLFFCHCPEQGEQGEQGIMRIIHR